MMGRHPLEIALIMLVGLATATLLASWHLIAGPFATAMLLGLSVLKGRLILLDFLGLRAVRPVWRGLVTAWLVGLASFAWAASAARLFI